MTPSQNKTCRRRPSRDARKLLQTWLAHPGPPASWLGLPEDIPKLSQTINWYITVHVSWIYSHLFGSSTRVQLLGTLRVQVSTCIIYVPLLSSHGRMKAIFGHTHMHTCLVSQNILSHIIHEAPLSIPIYSYIFRIFRTMEVSESVETPPVLIHVHRIFPNSPSSYWGILLWRKPPQLKLWSWSLSCPRSLSLGLFA